jgi:hypothetical protein
MMSVVSSMPAASAVAVDRRADLRRQAAVHEAKAEAAAARGDMAESARLILMALDCERRAGSVGPQVLQLIKPRA